VDSRHRQEQYNGFRKSSNRRQNRNRRPIQDRSNRTCTQVLEDGVELSSGYHRHVVVAGQDYSNESAEVQAICAAVHTDAVIAAYTASQEK
jgi:hypothetical protein